MCCWMDQGGAKIQEANLIFQDLSERYQSTSLLLNGKAVCCMHMGNFDEAETLLVEALNKARLICTSIYLINLLILHCVFLFRRVSVLVQNFEVLE